MKGWRWTGGGVGGGCTQHTSLLNRAMLARKRASPSPGSATGTKRNKLLLEGPPREQPSDAEVEKRFRVILNLLSFNELREIVQHNLPPPEVMRPYAERFYKKNGWAAVSDQFVEALSVYIAFDDLVALQRVNRHYHHCFSKRDVVATCGPVNIFFYRTSQAFRPDHRTKNGEKGVNVTPYTAADPLSSTPWKKAGHCKIFCLDKPQNNDDVGTLLSEMMRLKSIRVHNVTFFGAKGIFSRVVMQGITSIELGIATDRITSVDHMQGHMGSFHKLLIDIDKACPNLTDLAVVVKDKGGGGQGIRSGTKGRFEKLRALKISAPERNPSEHWVHTFEDAFRREQLRTIDIELSRMANQGRLGPLKYALNFCTTFSIKGTRRQIQELMQGGGDYPMMTSLNITFTDEAARGDVITFPIGTMLADASVTGSMDPTQFNSLVKRFSSVKRLHFNIQVPPLFDEVNKKFKEWLEDQMTGSDSEAPQVFSSWEPPETTNFPDSETTHLSVAVHRPSQESKNAAMDRALNDEDDPQFGKNIYSKYVGHLHLMPQVKVLNLKGLSAPSSLPAKTTELMVRGGQISTLTFPPNISMIVLTKGTIGKGAFKALEAMGKKKQGGPIRIVVNEYDEDRQGLSAEAFAALFGDGNIALKLVEKAPPDA